MNVSFNTDISKLISLFSDKISFLNDSMVLSILLDILDISLSNLRFSLSMLDNSNFNSEIFLLIVSISDCFLSKTLLSYLLTTSFNFSINDNFSLFLSIFSSYDNMVKSKSDTSNFSILGSIFSILDILVSFSKTFIFLSLPKDSNVLFIFSNSTLSVSLFSFNSSTFTLSVSISILFLLESISFL